MVITAAVVMVSSTAMPTRSITNGVPNLTLWKLTPGHLEAHHTHATLLTPKVITVIVIAAVSA